MNADKYETNESTRCGIGILERHRHLLDVRRAYCQIDCAVDVYLVKPVVRCYTRGTMSIGIQALACGALALLACATPDPDTSAEAISSATSLDRCGFAAGTVVAWHAGVPAHSNGGDTGTSGGSLSYQCVAYAKAVARDVLRDSLAWTWGTAARALRQFPEGKVMLGGRNGYFRLGTAVSPDGATMVPELTPTTGYAVGEPPREDDVMILWPRDTGRAGTVYDDDPISGEMTGHVEVVSKTYHDSAGRTIGLDLVEQNVVTSAQCRSDGWASRFVAVTHDDVHGYRVEPGGVGDMIVAGWLRHDLAGVYANGWHDDATSDAFRAAYDRAGKYIGWACDNAGGPFVHGWNGMTVQDVCPPCSIEGANACGGSRSVLVLGPPTADARQVAYRLAWGFRNYFLTQPEALHRPLSDEIPLANNRACQVFELGYLSWNGTAVVKTSTRPDPACVPQSNYARSPTTQLPADISDEGLGGGGTTSGGLIRVVVNDIAPGATEYVCASLNGSAAQRATAVGGGSYEAVIVTTSLPIDVDTVFWAATSSTCSSGWARDFWPAGNSYSINGTPVNLCVPRPENATWRYVHGTVNTDTSVSNSGTLACPGGSAGPAGTSLNILVAGISVGAGEYICATVNGSAQRATALGGGSYKATFVATSLPIDVNTVFWAATSSTCSGGWARDFWPAGNSYSINGTPVNLCVPRPENAVWRYVHGTVNADTSVSNSGTLTCPGSYLTPTVSVLPGSGPRGTTFNEPGIGFTPSGGVTLHFRQPNGVEATPVAKIADASGNYAHSYISGANTMTGIWTYWAVDNTTAIQSNTMSFTITLAPTVSVSPGSGPRGTTFNEPGTGFTPNGGVTLHFRQPNGVEATPVAKTADASGNYAHSYTSGANTMTGTWIYWAIDNTTAISSNTFSFAVTP